MADEKKPQTTRRENPDQEKAAPSVEHAAPRVRRKEDISFEHSLVKLVVAPMKKNTGYKEVAKPADIDNVEHVHYYHSHDDRGVPQKYSSSVGGHFHEVTIDWTRADAQGNPVIKVGPPIVKEKKLNSRGTMVSRLTSVTFKVEDPGGNEVLMQDDHIHVGEYKHTETLRPKTRNLQSINLTMPQPKEATIAEV